MFKRFLFAMMVLVSVNSFSQETSIAPGAKSALFSFSGLSTLGAGAFEGGVGVKYFLNYQSAVRLGIQLGRTSTTTPVTVPAGWG